MQLFQIVTGEVAHLYLLEVLPEPLDLLRLHVLGPHEVRFDVEAGELDGPRPLAGRPGIRGIPPGIVPLGKPPGVRSSPDGPSLPVDPGGQGRGTRSRAG